MMRPSAVVDVSAALPATRSRKATVPALVALAAEWRPGRRRGRLSTPHLGARGPGGGAPVMVGKTFQGRTDELLAWQTTALQQITRHTTGHVLHVRPVGTSSRATNPGRRCP